MIALYLGVYFLVLYLARLAFETGYVPIWGIVLCTMFLLIGFSFPFMMSEMYYQTGSHTQAFRKTVSLWVKLCNAWLIYVLGMAGIGVLIYFFTAL